LSVRGYWGTLRWSVGPTLLKTKEGPSHSATAAPLYIRHGDGWGQVCRARSATNSIAAPIIWDLLFRAKSLLVVVRLETPLASSSTHQERKWPQPICRGQVRRAGRWVSAPYPLCGVRRGPWGPHQFGEAAMLTTLPVRLSTSDLAIASRP
jgi:hypothetical protein